MKKATSQVSLSASDGALLELIDLEVAASRAFETAAKKMRKECPCIGQSITTRRCEGCAEAIVNRERSSPLLVGGACFTKCSNCKGTGTVGLSPLELAEQLQDGRLADLWELGKAAGLIK